MITAHVDTFARDNLPAADLQPEFTFDLPALQFPAQLNCATELLDRHVAEGRGDRVCIRAPGLTWTYADLGHRASRITNVLVQDMGLVPGNRVLLRAPNNPMLVACWFAVMKAGGIAVATMPLLRAGEELYKAIVEIGQVGHALCDAALSEDMRLTALEAPLLRRTCATSTTRAPTAWRPRWSAPRPTSTTWPPPATTPACWASPRAPPACPRPPCTSTAT